MKNSLEESVAIIARALEEIASEMTEIRTSLEKIEKQVTRPPPPPLI